MTRLNSHALLRTTNAEISTTAIFAMHVWNNTNKITDGRFTLYGGYR